MKEDKLRSFIQDNQDAFETEVPSGSIWKNIEREFTQKEGRVISIKKFYSMIAGLVIIFGITTVYMFNREVNKEEIAIVETEENNQIELSFSAFSSDLAEVETYYITEVNNRLKELKSFEVDEEILEEIELLNTEFDALKIEMGLSVDPQIIIEAMIDNYRLRLEILEDLLEELNTKGNDTKTNEIKKNEVA